MLIYCTERKVNSVASQTNVNIKMSKSSSSQTDIKQTEKISIIKLQ